MNVTNPAAWFLAAVAIPVIACYLLQRRTRSVRVSSVMFWDAAFRRRTHPAIWLRLRYVLSLLLQLAFIALLITALLDLRPAGSADSARRHVIVLDNSASMQAGPVDASRLEVAREAALRVIDQLGAGDRAAVITAGSKTRVVCGMTSDRTPLEQAIRSVEPTDGPTVVAEAVQLARQLISPTRDDRGRVIVLTDGGFSELQNLADAPDVALQLVGGDQPNVGITGFQTRRSPEAPLDVQLFVAVTNFDSRPATCRLDLDLDDQPADAIPLSLQPEATWTATLRIRAPGGRVLTARLTDADMFGPDNSAVAILPRQTPLPVTLVTPGNQFLRGVLEASELVELTVTQDIPDAAPEGGLLIIHATPFDEIPFGSVVVIQPVSDSRSWDFLGNIRNPRIAVSSTKSDLLRDVSLDDVLSPQAADLRLRGDHTVLAATPDNQPLVMTVSRPEGPLVVVALSVGDGDLPLRTAFPIFMTNVITSLTSMGDSDRLNVITGRAFPLDDIHAAPTGSGETPASFLLTDPDGTTTSLTGTAPLSCGPLNRIGVWKLTETSVASPARSISIAASLLDSTESELRVPDVDSEFVALNESGTGGPPVWWLATLAAGILICGEWLLFHRRWIG